MDNLKIPAAVFYNGVPEFEKIKNRFATSAGAEMQLKACQRKQIKDAKESQYRRRVYQSTYLHRCTNEDGTPTGHMTLDNFEQLGPRWIQDASDIDTRQGHTGWYTADHCGDTLIGVVLCFTRHGSSGTRVGQEGDDNFGETKPKGCVIYMAGTRHTDWDGVTLDLDTTDDPLTAARWADQMAERDAEVCREDDEKYQRERQVEDLAEQIKEARKDCLKLLREMRPIRKGLTGFPEAVYDTLCKQVSDYLGDIAKWRDEIGELT